MQLSGLLTLTYRRMYQQEAAMVTPEDVIRTLNKAGVGFVLMGTHGVGGWRDEPRATQDVDVLVPKKEHRKAVRALQERYPDLTIQDSPIVTRFVDPASNKSVIDVMKPAQEVYRIVFRHTVRVGKSYRIPTLEMALISKFAAMTSRNRSQEKKLIDASDFINIVRKNANEIDRRKLRLLGNKVYPNGGREVLQMVDDIIAGRPIEV